MTELISPSAADTVSKRFPNSLAPIKVVVADDHPVVIIGITDVLKREPNIQLLSAAPTIAELFETLRHTPCDILITDYSFEGDSEPDGMYMLGRVRRTYPMHGKKH